jgi:hypothetical protein
LSICCEKRILTDLQWWYDKAALSQDGAMALASCGIDRSLTSSIRSGFSFTSCSSTEIDVRFPFGPINLFTDVVVDSAKCTSARFSFIPQSGNSAWAVGVIPESRQREADVIWKSPTGWNMGGSGARTTFAHKAFARAESEKLICTVSVDSRLCELTLDVAGVIAGKLKLQQSMFPLRLGMCGHSGTCVRVVRGHQPK